MNVAEKMLIVLGVLLIAFIIGIGISNSFGLDRKNAEVNRWLSACRGEGGIASLVATNRVECLDKNNQIIYLKICEQINCN